MIVTRETQIEQKNYLKLSFKKLILLSFLTFYSGIGDRERKLKFCKSRGGRVFV